MSELLDQLLRLLNGVILPNLRAMQASQAEQIAASNRVERDIAALRAHLDAQFNRLNAQLTACRAELAATQAVLKASQGGDQNSKGNRMVH
jgi:septal ring factor EnvC (AmiA/AmiB activator)